MRQEILSDNLPLAIVGLLIVFGVLSIIALMISWMRQMDERWRFQEKRQNAEALDRAPTIDATTLVLISAAAATVLRGRFQIRSIRRLMPANHPRSPWSAQGRSTLQGSHTIDRKRVRNGH
jgi:Na+-transporting methylmalonyl-CoA/oxaloacetate decarboxylase gamma subunit